MGTFAKGIKELFYPMNNRKVKVFISYSWDSDDHQHWVLNLADKINVSNIECVVDKTHLKYGGHIKTFMLSNIIDSDIVLIILTPEYRKKADKLEGGAGYEYNIINDELFKIITKNNKFIPIIRQGDFEKSVTHFLKGFNCVDLRDSDKYESNFNELLNQIISFNSNSIKNDSPQMETKYKEIDSLVYELQNKAKSYFCKLFKPEKALDKVKLKMRIHAWEKEIEKYSSHIQQIFSSKKMSVYENYLEDFKKVFGKELWTVSAALKTKDPDLARYKKDYRDADAGEIYDTINSILSSTHDYVRDKCSCIIYSDIQHIDDLHIDYLNESDMFMNKIIGYGIRSEILHRYYPEFLPIMTQKSLWAMYFICDSADEFITIEQRNNKGIMRVSHNWQYPYDRFTFLMTNLFKYLKEWFGEFDIDLDEKYRFGYVNLFLSDIHEYHKSDTKLLHEWVDTY